MLALLLRHLVKHVYTIAHIIGGCGEHLYMCIIGVISDTCFACVHVHIYNYVDRALALHHWIHTCLCNSASEDVEGLPDIPQSNTRQNGTPGYYTIVAILILVDCLHACTFTLCIDST